jgi:hypothetical protein
MTEQEWFAATSPDDLIKYLRLEWRVDRRVRLLGVACGRVLTPWLVAPQSHRALELVERIAEQPDAAHEQLEAANRAGHRGRAWADRAADRCSAPASAVSHLAGLGIDVPFFTVAYQLQQAAEELGQREYMDVVMVSAIRDIFGNPFRPVAFDPSWRTSAAVGLARSMYESRDFAAMPVLADALEEAGCDNPDVLAHCRDPDGAHVRGCWVVDLVLGKNDGTLTGGGVVCPPF